MDSSSNDSSRTGSPNTSIKSIASFKEKLSIDSFPGMRRTQSLKSRPSKNKTHHEVADAHSSADDNIHVPKGISGLKRATMSGSVPNLTREEREATLTDLYAHVDGINLEGRRSRRASSCEPVTMPVASSDYQRAMQEFDDDDTREEGRCDTPQPPIKLKPLKFDKKKSAAKFNSKTAEQICLKNFKSPYPKYMNKVKLDPLGISFENATPQSSPPSSPFLKDRSPLDPIGSAREKKVTWGEVFTFDKSVPYNAAGGTPPDTFPRTVLQDVPEEEQSSPPRLRRVSSAKNRPKPSLNDVVSTPRKT